MKRKTIVKRLFGIVALILLGYCLIAYLYVQSQLTAAMPEPSRLVRLLGDVTVPALFLVGLYHLFLLTDALKRTVSRDKNVLGHSIFLVLIVLSGLTLLSGWTLLSDIGKEYLLWDVTTEWVLLYAGTFLHFFVVIAGFVSHMKPPPTDEKLFKAVEKGSDVLFLSMHHIAFIAGLLGFGGVVFASTGLIVPERFMDQFMLLLAGLAAFPLILIVLYWIVKMRKKPLREWMDEKQISDMALGTLFCFLMTIPLYFLICAVDLFKLLALSISFWILLMFFLQLVVFSVVILIKNRSLVF